MFVGIFQFELFIPESNSLKEKRFILSSIKTKLRNRYNISIAEVGHNEKWQRAVLGISVVANEKRFIDEVAGKILAFIEKEFRVQIIDYTYEIMQSATQEDNYKIINESKNYIRSQITNIFEGTFLDKLSVFCRQCGLTISSSRLKRIKDLTKYVLK